MTQTKKTSDEVYKFKIKPTYEMYYSEETNYGVYCFTSRDNVPKLTKDHTFQEGIFTGKLAGNMQRLSMDMEYEVEGTLDYSKKYSNWQYKPLVVTPPKLDSPEKTKMFLETIITSNQSEVLLSIYPKIIDMIINDEKVDLSLTKGIKDATFSKIKEKVIENYGISDLLILLQPLGVSLKAVKKIMGNETNPTLVKQKLIENPYVLTKIKGLGFKRVDVIALKLNPELKISEHRTKSFITYYLKSQGESEGHTWISLKQLTNEVKSNLHECFEVFKEIITKEKDKSTFLHIEGNTVGLKINYDTEKEILNRLIEIENAKCDIKNINVAKGIEITEKQLGFKLTEEQKDAIKSIDNQNIVIITAPAGAGKTVSVNGIINSMSNAQIDQTALSAKAAQRMKEVTKKESMTIHRLLKWSEVGFEFNESNKLENDVTILDEASMVNATLFLDLIRAVQPGKKLVIVFDFAQLSPIGNGNVATDLLKSKLFKINKFTKIHRQAEKSGILLDANKIRQGINPLEKPQSSVTHGELKDMHYIFKNKRSQINDTIVNSFMKSLNTSSLDETVIIVPRKKDCINSTYELNKRIQNLLLPNERIVMKRGEMEFKLGAKVIQKVNDYEKDVFNGEIGYIFDINSSGFMIKFNNGKIVVYTKSDIKNIELAYALTVHSCQGSQWETVIIGIDSTHYILLDSTLLYTAITRASKRCLLISEPKAFKTCIDNNKSKIRKTYLSHFITIYNQEITNNK